MVKSMAKRQRKEQQKSGWKGQSSKHSRARKEGWKRQRDKEKPKKPKERKGLTGGQNEDEEDE